MAKEKTTEQDFSFLNNEDNSKATGFEKIGMQEQAIPFIRVAQDLTSQTKENKPEYIEGLKPGMIFNTVTKEIYTDLKVVCGGFDHVFVEWPPEESGRAPVAYHTPEAVESVVTPESRKEFGKWKTASGNKLVETYMYYILIVGREAEGIAVISMKSSEIKIAKQWNRQLMNKVMPNGIKAKPWFLTWNLGSGEVSKNNNSWYQFKVEWDGYVNEELYKNVTSAQECLPNVGDLDMKQLEAPTSSSEEADKESDVNY